MDGRTVYVSAPTYTYDANKNESVSWSEPEAVDDVLVAPNETADVDGTERFHGTRRQLKFAFPKGYSASLRGCRITVGGPFGGTYEVVGDPSPNMVENCPTRWWYTAVGARVDG